MAQVEFLHDSERGQTDALRDSMFRLRHRVFKERLGWDVASIEGREQDKYDRMHPVYLLCRNQEEVEGCWRLLPTSGPYMLKDEFPELLSGHTAPQDDRIWEISRFAIQAGQKGYRSLAGVHKITARMYEQLFAFGLTNGIDQIVGVTDVLCERLLTRVGVNIQRFGPPQQIGVTMAVAGWLDVTPENLERVRRCADGKPEMS